jgi:steroid delta-isomerase-like uncharacterized protein
MSAENKAIVRRVIDSIATGNVDEAARSIAPDYVWHGPGVEVRGLDGWKQVVTSYLTAFPDLSFTIEDQIAEGDKVATRYTAHGTHRGELAGVAASGRVVAVPCLAVDRIVDGKVVETFEVFDQLGMFAAIGTLPALPESV